MYHQAAYPAVSAIHEVTGMHAGLQPSLVRYVFSRISVLFLNDKHAELLRRKTVGQKLIGSPVSSVTNGGLFLKVVGNPIQHEQGRRG